MMLYLSMSPVFSGIVAWCYHLQYARLMTERSQVHVMTLGKLLTSSEMPGSWES